MREIKFRAWDKKSRQLHHTGFFVTPSGSIKLIEYYWDKKPDLILMQYTGIFDKNGREIYEGDIIDWVGGDNIKHKYEVKFGLWECLETEIVNHGCGYGWYADSHGTNKECPVDGFYPGDGKTIRECEVIGNIHENKELL